MRLVWRRMVHISMETANAVAIAGVLAIAAAVYCDVTWPRNGYAGWLLGWGALALGFFFLHVIADADWVEGGAARAMDRGAVQERARVWIAAHQDGRGRRIQAQELRHLLEELDAVRDHGWLRQVVASAAHGLRAASVPERLRATRVFQSLAGDAPRPFLHEEMSRVMLAAARGERHRRVYRAMADVLTDLARWGFKTRTNLSVVHEVVREFRRESLAPSREFPDRARAAFLALRSLSDRELLGALADLLYAMEPEVRREAYQLSRDLWGRWVRSWSKRRFLAALARRPTPLTDLVREEWARK